MPTHHTRSKTILTSNLNQTIRESAYLVERDHFRLRNKDGGLVIQSVIAENPMLHANFTALSSIKLELLPSGVLHSGNMGIFALFAPVTLTLTR